MAYKGRKVGFLLATALFVFSSCTSGPETPTGVANAGTSTAPPQDTSTPLFTPSTEPTIAPSPTPTEQPTQTAAPASPTPPSETQYAVVGVESNDMLNMRAGAGVDHPVTATIPPNGVNIRITGDGKDVGQSTWVPVEFQGQRGWVNKYYLAEQRGPADPRLLKASNQILLALEKRNLSRIAEYVHPDECLRFSPYPTILPEHQVFCQDKLRNLPSDNTQYTWGSYDGTGKPIELTFGEYFQEFIYDVDFAHPELIGFNQAIGTGNAINNIPDFYPGGVFVEYHFPGFDPQYGGMDWRSLRLVFMRIDQEWHLVGIVHGEWTI